LMRAAELLDARITGLSQQATFNLHSGERVPFFRLESTQGRDKWKQRIDEVIALGDLMGVDLRKPQEAITPKQAIKKGLPEDVIGAYVEKTSGTMKLVLDDGREARKILGRE